MLSLFVVYHKLLYDNFYKTISEDNKKYITFYGVKDKVENTPLQIPSIFEYELPIFNKTLQENRFNESSAMYHIYENKLYQNVSYIGFAQYDMNIHDEALTAIKTQIINNRETPIIFAAFFAIEESKIHQHGSLNLITKPISFFGSILDNYNRFFSKTYSKDNIMKSPWIMCNTFIIPVAMYEKYMLWLSSYFLHDINVEELNKICCENYGYLDTRENIINRGHLIEVCTAVFLAIEIIEGALIQSIDLDHEHNSRV